MEIFVKLLAKADSVLFGVNKSLLHSRIVKNYSSSIYEKALIEANRIGINLNKHQRRGLHEFSRACAAHKIAKRQNMLGHLYKGTNTTPGVEDLLFDIGTYLKGCTSNANIQNVTRQLNRNIVNSSLGHLELGNFITKIDPQLQQALAQKFKVPMSIFSR